jgi:hypothetical protein
MRRICVNCGVLFELEPDQKLRVLICQECKISEEFLQHLMRRIDGTDPDVVKFSLTRLRSSNDGVKHAC